MSKGSIGARTHLVKGKHWRPNLLVSNHIDSFGNPYYAPKKTSHRTNAEKRIKVSKY